MVQGVTRPEISQPSVHACMCSEQGAEWGAWVMMALLWIACIADHHCNITFKSLSLLCFSLSCFSRFLSLPPPFSHYYYLQRPSLRPAARADLDTHLSKH